MDDGKREAINAAFNRLITLAGMTENDEPYLLFGTLMLELEKLKREPEPAILRAMPGLFNITELEKQNG